MKAAVYEGPRTVTVKDVPDAKIEHPGDILVKITTTNICGSDLHMYEGRTSFETGRTLGHENLGQVVEVGQAVSKVKVGDWVVLPFNIACGFCKQCEQGLTNYCLTMQPEPDMAGAAYGFAEMGPYQGGQAELLRVPYGDFNALRLGEDAAERQLDYVMLADIFPTGYHATEMAGVKPGDQTIVYGAGPVGLMAAYSAILKGAGRVWVADHHPDRLRLAEEIGAIAISTAEQDPAEVVKEATLGLGADNGCECVGYQAHDPQGEEDATLTMNGLIESVRFTGGIGVVGVFLPEDPGGAEAQGELEAQGKVPLDFGMLWFKGQHIGTGQAPVKRYNRALRDLIAGGKAQPSFLVSHELGLDEASSAYEHFDNRDDGWTKVVLHPNGSAGSGRRTSAAKRSGRTTGGSSEHTLEELRREARAQGIEGRSHMNKQQLERALEH
ncbi:MULTISPECIES: alcohol dehydrogenase catalytic domain-containing protein [Streptomyces]|uniref:alcohol dehydrogenase catalytic domain-containing protein n=1 Tax=Streptomyces TaxID=1883 RepID=UPI0004BD4158|nr:MULTISPECIES: alcohol dehydrogenase catalytic domain-containing protein [Streptomyces]KJY20948.1 aldehyde dehydrogenase [Streptomyces sp. NRRL S-104]KOU34329.1 aldehyde dehydrogenase [Streptomyces sp. WM6373]KOU61424.1 aldehyde dehydrogenase [Streptomyces sp. IGB124]KOU87765.1 aldehyde dehydrogenase [Streptomyces sp. XY58]KOV06463.1 aldehyde dehydrogenase [Streptomyces sp. XY37]